MGMLMNDYTGWTKNKLLPNYQKIDLNHMKD